jgi:hypothetical protein
VLHTLNRLHTLLEDTTMTTVQKAEIKKIARLRDKATEQYLEVIEFPTSRTRVNKLTLPPSLVSEPVAFGKRLRDAGAILPKGKEELTKLLATVAKSDPPEERVYEAQTGWTQDRKSFVLVDGVIGNAATKIIGVNRINSVIVVGCRTAVVGNPGGMRWPNRLVSPPF